MTAVVREPPGMPNAADSRLPTVDVHVDETNYTVTLDVTHLIDIGGFARILQHAMTTNPELAEDWRILLHNRTSATLQVAAANRIRKATGVADCFTVTLNPDRAYLLSKQLDEASEEPASCAGRYCNNFAEEGQSLCPACLADI